MTSGSNRTPAACVQLGHNDTGTAQAEQQAMPGSDL